MQRRGNVRSGGQDGAATATLPALDAPFFRWILARLRLCELELGDVLSGFAQAIIGPVGRLDKRLVHDRHRVRRRRPPGAGQHDAQNAKSGTLRPCAVTEDERVGGARRSNETLSARLERGAEAYASEYSPVTGGEARTTCRRPNTSRRRRHRRRPIRSSSSGAGRFHSPRGSDPRCAGLIRTRASRLRISSGIRSARSR